MKPIIKFSFFLVILLALAGSVNAFFPVYHYSSLAQACENNHATGNAKICCDNLEYCTAGANLADITVVSYFTEMGKYDATHSYAYCKQLMDIATEGCAGNQQCVNHQLAFAYGNCVHLIQDTISHNIMIPHAVRYTLVPNLLIHAPAEYKYDRVFKNDADYTSMEKSLKVAICDIEADPGIQTEGCKLVSMMQKALVATSSYSDDQVNAYELSSWYIKSVVNDRKEHGGAYSMGTGAYITALPFIYKAIYVIIVLLCTLILVQMIRLKKKGKFVKVIMGFTIFLWLFTIAGVIALMTNKVYAFFLLILYPISLISPIGDPVMLDQQVQSLINQFFIQGHNAVATITENFGTPTGFGINRVGIEGGIQAAQGPIEIIWIFIVIAIIGYFTLMIWKTFDLTHVIFKRKKRRK